MTDRPHPLAKPAETVGEDGWTAAERRNFRGAMRRGEMEGIDMAESKDGEPFHLTGGNTSQGLPIPEEPGAYEGDTACMDPADPERVTHTWSLGAWREEG